VRVRLRLRELDLTAASADGSVALVQLSPPVNVDRARALLELSGEALDEAYDSSGARFTLPASQLVRLANGAVETRKGLCYIPRLGFVAETLRPKRDRYEKHGYIFHGRDDLTLPPRPTLGFDFPAVAGGLAAGPSYSHWLFDTVGRYLAVRDLVPEDARLVVNYRLTPSQLDALAAADIDPALVVELPKDHIVAFPVLYVPPTGAPIGLAPAVIRALRSLAKPRDRGRRLYISRADALVRRVVNEADVLATLGRHGFVHVVAGSLPFREQVELFSEAEAVVGAHGAGLANAVFCPVGARLIELQPGGYGKRRTLLYWDLAALCDLRYGRVTGQRAPDWKADFHVDCAQLDTVLRRQLD
jgi:Glycosyltransferase 61